MSTKFKLFLLAFPISILSLNAHSRGFDIYPNPYFTDASLETTFVNKLRNTSIKDMNKMIKGECRQYRDYVNLSIQNWDLAKFKHKSLNEAESYSNQLISQIPYQQSQQYTFPFGIRTYAESEQILKNAVLHRTEPLKKQQLVDDMYYTCIQMNSQKYFIILTSDRYLTKDQSIFLPKNELLKNFDSSNSILRLDYVPSDKDKLTPPNVGKKINFSEKDLLVANSLIDNDIEVNFSIDKVRWIDYKKASRDMQSSFEKFMKEGGRNKNFALIASLVKYKSLETNNFRDIEVRDQNAFRNIFNNDKSKQDEKFKNLLKNFNY